MDDDHAAAPGPPIAPPRPCEGSGAPPAPGSERIAGNGRLRRRVGQCGACATWHVLYAARVPQHLAGDSTYPPS